MSVEELHIALADDTAKLVDINEIGQEEESDDESNDEVTSLYAGGFSANSFVDVIECSKIWQDIEDKS